MVKMVFSEDEVTVSWAPLRWSRVWAKARPMPWPGMPSALAAR
jgi:hypothetical protein